LVVEFSKNNIRELTYRIFKTKNTKACHSRQAFFLSK